MLRDQQFPMHYKGFMEELLLKGYPRESTKSPNDGQVWYLPHNGIYHPSKPNLRIFVSNSKKVLHSIPETFRRSGVKDKNLDCKLLNEQALGILWNVEADTLGFKIAI